MAEQRGQLAESGRKDGRRRCWSNEAFFLCYVSPNPLVNNCRRVLGAGFKYEISWSCMVCELNLREIPRSCSHTLSSFLVSYLPLCLSPSLGLCLATLALLPPSFLPLNLSLAQELLFREISTTPKTTESERTNERTNERELSDERKPKQQRKTSIDRRERYPLLLIAT